MELSDRMLQEKVHNHHDHKWLHESMLLVSILINSGIFAGFQFKFNFKMWFMASQWLFFQLRGNLVSDL